MVPDREAIAKIDDGRQRLVQAAARLLVDGEGQLLHDGLTQKALSVLTQKHPSNFQSHFADKNELLIELIGALMAPLRIDDIEAEIQELRAISGAGGPGIDIGAVVRHISARFEAGAPGGQRARALLALWAVAHNDPEIGPVVSRALARSEPDLVFILGGIGEQWGLALREPWDPAKLGMVVRALLYGFEVQEAARPGSTQDLVYLTLVSLLPVMTRFEHEDRLSVEDLVARMGASVEGYWSEGETEPLNPGGREALFVALEAQLEETGYSNTTLVDVAARAKLPYESVAKAMGNVDELICRRLRDRLEPLGREVAFDSKTELFDTAQMVGRHLVRLAAGAGAVPGLTRGWLAALSGGATPSPAALQLVRELAAPLHPLVATLLGEDGDASVAAERRVRAALAHAAMGGEPDLLLVPVIPQG